MRRILKIMLTLLPLFVFFVSVSAEEEKVPLSLDLKSIYKVVGDLYGNLANLYLRTGNYADALKMLTKALPLFEGADDPRGQGTIYHSLGNVHSRLGETKEATEMYEKALSFYERAGDLIGQGVVRLNLGDIYLKTNHDQMAHDMFTRALDLSEQANDDVGRGNAFGALGDFFTKSGDDQKGLEMYEEALSLYGKSKAPLGQGDIHMKLGHVYARLNKDDDALAMFEKAQEFYRNSHDLAGQGAAHTGAGHIYLRKGEGAKALESYEKALSFFVKVDDPFRIADLSRIIGNIYFGRSSDDRAIEYYQKALPVFIKFDDRYGLDNIYTNLGKIYFDKGDLDKAIEMYGRALDVTIDPAKPNLYGLLGEIYLAAGNYGKALEMHQKAVSSSIGSGDAASQGIAYGRLGSFYFLLGDDQKARESYEKALRLHIDAKDAAGQANVYSGLGYLHAWLGNTDLALDMYEKALTFYEKLNAPFGRATIYAKKGDLYQWGGDYAKALDMYRKALSFYGEKGALKERGNVYKNIGDLSFQAGDLKTALEMYDKSYALYRKTGSIEAQSYVLTKKAKALAKRGEKDQAARLYEDAITRLEKVRRQGILSDVKKKFFEKAYFSYEETVLFMVQNDHYDLAFKYGESMKARVFLDQLAEGLVDLEKGIDPELKKARDALENRLVVINQQFSGDPTGTWSPYDELKMEDLRKSYEETEKELEEVRKEIQLRNPLYASMQYPDPVTIEGLQRDVLKKDEVLLEYFLSNEGVYCFVVTQDRYVVERLPATKKDVEKRAGDLYQALLSGDRWGIFSLKMYQDLIKPLEKHIQGRSLIVVPDGILALIPFEILMTREGPATVMMLEKYRIKYVQSASVLSMLRKHYRKEGVNDRFIGFGDPVYDYEDFIAGRPEKGSLESADSTKPGIAKWVARGYEKAGGTLDRLEGSGEEVRKIGEIFREAKKEQMTRLRLDAREEYARSEEMKNFGYIHFSAHGILDSRFQAIALSQIPDSKDDGFLTLNKIMNSRYNANLVVLSACQTGLGKMERGEGVTGLTRAVMYAGSPAVVVSLWAVEDIATKELLVKFYEKMIKGGLSKEDALREAKLELLKDEKFESPYFWSAFVMYGE